MNTVEHCFLDCYGSKGATLGAHDAFDIAPVATATLGAHDAFDIAPVATATRAAHDAFDIMLPLLLLLLLLPPLLPLLLLVVQSTSWLSHHCPILFSRLLAQTPSTSFRVLLCL
jgi:hypothetical protein